MSAMKLRFASPVVAGLLAASAAAQTTLRASVDSNGAQENNYSGLYGQSVSGNGRFVAFNSGATNLVPGGSPLAWAVFLHDFMTGATSMVSVDSSGNFGTGLTPSISDDGTRIAFDSGTAFVPADNNGRTDIYLHDVVSGATTLISADGSGNPFYGGQCGAAATSGDGRFVAFHFIISKTKYHFTDNVFVKDTQSGTLTCASVDSNGAETYLHSLDPAISDGGGFVAFYSNQDSLVSGDANGKADVVVRDMVAGVSSLASVDSNGVQGNGDSSDAAISADGRFVAFTSLASNLVAGDLNGRADVFLRDRQTGVTTLVSVDSAGNQADADCLHPSLSADGSLVSFASAATNLVAGDTNGVSDVFVHDMATGATTCWSVAKDGAIGDHASDTAELSADGRFACFKSVADNLVPNDTDGTDDVFLHGAFLTLEADPSTVTAGDTLTITTWRAQPSAPVMLALVGLNGMPTFLPLVVTTCDSTGEWSVTATVPSGLAGSVLTFQSFAIVDTGKADASAPATLTIQ